MNKESLKARVEKLTLAQQKLLAIQVKGIRQEAGVGGQNSARLIAYLIGDDGLTADSLKSQLKAKLPEYMVPSNFVQLEAFPRLPNGKIDAKSLLAMENRLDNEDSDFVAPRTENEKKLATIWGEVLNIEQIGIHDNYFEIGGDSILSIQIIAKASKVGISLKPNALFDHQTIAQLALVAKEKTTNSIKEDDPTDGQVPLLPIQRWFFEEFKNAPHHWNQGLIFNEISGIDKASIQQAFNYMIEHHDGLRQHFFQSEGEMQARIQKFKRDIGFHYVDLSATDPALQQRKVEDKISVLQSTLSLASDLLFQCIFFEGGSGASNTLVLFAHHLVVDAVSWGIIVEDFKVLCSQAVEDKPLALPEKTTSYKAWGTYLASIATDSRITDTTEFWLSQANFKSKLPQDFEKAEVSLEKDTTVMTFSLDAASTKQLTTESINTYNTKTDEFLLAVLSKVITDWSHLSHLELFLERHGRETEDTDLQLTATAGWFTSFFPIKIDVKDKENTALFIKSVKEQLRKIPFGGIGYGILRYLSPEEGIRHNLRANPSIIFNYLGKLAVFSNKVLGPSTDISVGTRHETSERSHQLEINAFIQDDQLTMRWFYDAKKYKQETIQSLVNEFEETLRNFITHCSAPDAGGFTPSDFPEAGLSQDDLDNLLGEIEL